MHRKRFMGVRVTYRYLAGRPLNGILYTDCGYLRPGRKVLHPTGHASRWARLPGWKRQAFRIGTPATALAWLVFHAMWPLATSLATGWAAVGLAALGARVVADRVMTWKWNRNVFRPMVSALVPYAELPEDLVGKRLVIEQDTVTVPLAPHHNGQAAKIADIRRIVAQRMGGEYESALNLSQAPFYVRLTPAPEPPEKVYMRDIMAEIYATDIDHPIIGRGVAGSIVKLDFTGEIAHLACSIGTGGGKSSFCRLLISQLLYHGCNDVRIFDVKMVSLAELANLPGVSYFRHVEECWAGIADLHTEMQRRYDVLLQNSKATFSPIYVVLEEQNSFFEESDIHWKRILGNKGTPMVWSHVALLLLKARQVNIRLIGMYQRMSARVSGGGDLRDQYGQKFLSRFSHQAWDSLVGTRPRGKSSAVQGRAISILGAEHKTVQVAYCEPEEAVALATARTVVTVTAPGNHEVKTRVTSDSDRIPPRRYSFAEAAREPWCAVSYDTLKQRASRAKVSAKNKLTQDEILTLLGEKR